jgi:hypothetical protein
MTQSNNKLDIDSLTAREQVQLCSRLLRKIGNWELVMGDEERAHAIDLKAEEHAREGQ